MCLIDKKQFRIAEQDIPVFKVVFNGHFSPLKNTRLFRVNYITNTVQFEGDTLEEYRTVNNNSGYTFGINYYHALISRKRAKEFLENISPYYISTDKLTIVEGYIPEGTRYAINESENICARKMILNI